MFMVSVSILVAEMFWTVAVLLTASFPGLLQKRKRQRVKEAEVPIYHLQSLAELFYWVAQYGTDNVVSKEKIIYCAPM